ncbi:hypothetical protein ACG2F4_12700 [Halalkalibaculum sp. DA3122]|uniref:hypothetical protein n=1 Tax=unclassified Halalkalibaculum TaxID=2964617 RepID=UPI003754E6F4
MDSTEYLHKMHELVLNWKLRLVVSALFSMLGLAILVGTLSGYFMQNFEVLDQTIVGVAVFVIVIPIYLIVADLPKIDEHTIADLLNKQIPDLEYDTKLLLMDEEQMSEEEVARKKKVVKKFADEKLYRFLPTQPILQALLVMLACLLLTAGIHFYL